MTKKTDRRAFLERITDEIGRDELDALVSAGCQPSNLAGLLREAAEAVVDGAKLEEPAPDYRHMKRGALQRLPCRLKSCANGVEKAIKCLLMEGGTVIIPDTTSGTGRVEIGVAIGVQDLPLLMRVFADGVRYRTELIRAAKRLTPVAHAEAALIYYVKMKTGREHFSQLAPLLEAAAAIVARHKRKSWPGFEPSDIAMRHQRHRKNAAKCARCTVSKEDEAKVLRLVEAVRRARPS